MAPPLPRRSLPRLDLKTFALGVVLLVLVLGTVSGLTAANVVDPSRIGSATAAVTLAQLAPPECAGLPLTNLVYGNGGTVTGTAGADLIIAGEGARQAQGRTGDDCIVGGTGIETINGQQGFDVCIGPATATFRDCEVIVHR
jgi:Ca2+-binding RTX toxin-like protein